MRLAMVAVPPGFIGSSRLRRASSFAAMVRTSTRATRVSAAVHARAGAYFEASPACW